VTAVARGNVVLADHGLTVIEALPDAVPAPTLLRYRPDEDRCDADVADPIPARFSPVLGRRPLTHVSPYDAAWPAGAAIRTHVGAARPRIDLETGAGAPWEVRRDLLRSAPTASDFVVEVEADNAAQLRFGDGRHGARPAPGSTFVATYRVGNGTRGNVGRDAIAHLAPAIAGVASVRNPLPAIGGVDPEPVENVRRFAPVAFLTQERAVTADDYARMAERHPQIQRAAATFRWTGSWRTTFVTIDPLASVPQGGDLHPAIPAHLEPYRMAGHDVRVDTPRYVPLEIEMSVCVRREYFRADVKRALLEIFSARRLPDGRTGIFHPDNFSFGQPFYLSRLYAAAYEVDGVESAAVTTFQRQATPDPLPLAAGKLEFDRLEIARLENDRSLPERGVLRISVEGGK
jgi:predicted phage baseplate assembly protein